MQADADDIKIRSSYNLSGMSFTPKELAAEITKHYPDFTITYEPDFRQKIADSWPASIDDSEARKDWGWKNDFNIENMTVDMFKNLKATIYK
jgi:nucleoside-diphosphate-sugar epimerase